MDTNEKLLRMLAQDEQQKKWQEMCPVCHKPIIFSEKNHEKIGFGYRHLFPCTYGPLWAQ